MEYQCRRNAAVNKKYCAMEIYVLLAPANSPCPAAQEFLQLVRVIPAMATADAFSTAY